VLSWLDPSLPAGFNSLACCEIVELAREVVTQDVVVDTGRWHEIEVAPDRPRARSTMLSAIANKPIQDGSVQEGTTQARSPRRGEDPSRWHFHIAPDGRPIRGANWRDQRKIGNTPSAIRIGLETASSSGASITSAQWLCLRALVSAINDSAGGEGESLTVVVGGQADRLTRRMLEAHLR